VCPAFCKKVAALGQRYAAKDVVFDRLENAANVPASSAATPLKVSAEEVAWQPVANTSGSAWKGGSVKREPGAARSGAARALRRPPFGICRRLRFKVLPGCADNL